MKKVLIICAAGMSSSLIARKTTHYFGSKGESIDVEATPATLGLGKIVTDEFDLYLVSPQTMAYFEKFQALAIKKSKPIKSIPSEAYLPVPESVDKLARMIEEILKESEIKR